MLAVVVGSRFAQIRCSISILGDSAGQHCIVQIGVNFANVVVPLQCWRGVSGVVRWSALSGRRVPPRHLQQPDMAAPEFSRPPHSAVITTQRLSGLHQLGQCGVGDAVELSHR